MEDIKFAIKKELAEAVLNYIGRRPYIEVFNLIEGLKSLELIGDQDVVGQKPELKSSQPGAYNEGTPPAKAAGSLVTDDESPPVDGD